jgi:hypothetical protein
MVELTVTFARLGFRRLEAGSRGFDDLQSRFAECNECRRTCEEIGNECVRSV